MQPITCHDINKFEKLPWEEYCNLPGYSHSYLKREIQGVSPEFKETEKVRIGKLVDAIITGEQVDMSLDIYPICRDIASVICSNFGSVINQFEKQVSYSSEFRCNGFSMRSKGRLDFLLPNHAVIDLKITDTRISGIPALIKYMGYENQLWGYSRPSRVNNAFFIFYSVKDRKCFIPPMLDLSSPLNEFWEEKILKFGEVINNN